MAKVRLRPESGMLYFDFSYKGKRCREYTTLQNTAGNRKKMERVLTQIEREIAFGSFDYGRYFPTSKRASTFAINDSAACDSVKCTPQVDTPAADQRSLPTFFDFTQLWIEGKKIEWRLSYLAAVEPFSLGDVQQILARVRTDYRPYLIFRFFTAVRSGEVHGLKWKHIDFERRQVLTGVAANLHQVTDHYPFPLAR